MEIRERIREGMDRAGDEAFPAQQLKSLCGLIADLARGEADRRLASASSDAVGWRRVWHPVFTSNSGQISSADPKRIPWPANSSIRFGLVPAG